MSDKNYNQIYSSKTVVSCDGSVHKSPHPKIYLNLKPEGKATCPYCSAQFIYQEKK